MEWLGHAKTSFTHSPTPLKFKTKDGSTTDLLRICEESTPPCRLNPLLFNGHLQTMWTAIKNDGPKIYYKRKIFEAEDSNYEGTFAVDFAVKPFTESDDTLPIRTTYFSDKEFEDIGSLDNRPMLIILHGLSGGSFEIYLKHCLAPLTEANGDQQWEACVVNSRGCAMHKITSSLLYNARATWDCRQMVSWLRKCFPNRPLFAMGFSLGANILTNVSDRPDTPAIHRINSTVVYWRGGICVSVEGCSRLFQPLESRCSVACSPKNLDRTRGVFEDHGNKYEEACRASP